MNDPFLSLLGICKKSGNAVFGFDTVKFAMQKGSVNVVFSAQDLSEKTKKELLFYCDKTKTEHIQTVYDKKTLGSSIGKETGIIAVTDKGFADRLKQIKPNLANVEDNK